MEEVEPTGKDRTTMLVWNNTNNDTIVLCQYVLSNKTNINTENAEVIIWDDINVAIVEKDSKISAFWNTSEYAYDVITSRLSRDEILHIIKSIK